MSEQDRTCDKDCLSQRLQEKEAIINGISDSLILLDAKTYRILDVNQAFLSSYKVTREQVLGKTCYEITHHLSMPCDKSPGQHFCPLEESVKQGIVSRAEHIHQDIDGNALYFEIAAYPVKDEHGEIARIIHLSRDITDRKRAEEALREGSEKIKLFARSVVHDLKSPAIGIYGLTQRLHKQYTDVLDEKGNEYCDKIVNAAEQIAALVEKINVYLLTKEKPLFIEKCRIGDVLKLVRDEFSGQLSLRQIAWIEPESAPEINADRLSLIRIVRNLAGNALKHGGDGLSEIKIGYEETADLHVLSVRDDGMGLEKGRSKKILGVFERNNASGAVEGSGLGLAIVKEIAEQHKGKVWTECGGEKGTTFYVGISKDLELTDILP